MTTGKLTKTWFLEQMKKVEYLKELKLRLDRNQPLSDVLKSIMKKLNTEFPISISVANSSGKIIESSGDIHQLNKLKIKINNHLDYDLVIHYTILQEYEKRKVLILGESRSGKSSILNLINYGTNVQSLIRNLGFSSSRIIVNKFDVEFIEIGGNSKFICNLLKKGDLIQVADLVLYVLDNRYISRKDYYNHKFKSIKKMFVERRIPIKIVMNKKDQDLALESFYGLKEDVISRKRIFKSEDVLHYSAISGNSCVPLVNFLVKNLNNGR